MAESTKLAQRGLANTRRNRRWLALVAVLHAEGGDQEYVEALAWKLLTAVEITR